MRFGRRRIALAALLIVAIALVPLFRAWKRGSDNGGQQYVTPFRIAGNLYYVGANDVSAFLITGPQGHVLLDGGYPGTAALIMRSIRELGFDIRDVRALVNSEPHSDHAGGLAELKAASGAQLHATAASAYTMATGGDDPDIHWALRPFFHIGVLGYPEVTVDHRIRDGDTVRVGPVALAAHVTPGHTRGCTSWTFQVEDAGRTFDVVSACSLVILGVSNYDAQREDMRRTHQRLRALPADIWMTSHGRLWGRYRKFAARDSVADPVAPFLDRAGYEAYIAKGQSALRRGAMQ